MIDKGHEVDGSNGVPPVGEKRRRSTEDGDGPPEDPAQGDPECDPPALLLAASFARRVRGRFADRPYMFEAFVVALLSWRAGRKSLTEVYDELSLLFRGEGDLLDELGATFLSTRSPGNAGRVPRPAPPGQAQGAPSDHCLPAIQRRAPPLHQHALIGGDLETQPGLSKTRDFLALVRSKLPPGADAYRDFLKLLRMFGDGVLTLEKLREVVADTFPGAARSCNLFFDHCYARSALDDSDEEDAEDPQLEAAGQLGVYLNNPLASLDLHEWEACPPSYRRIPDTYPHLESRGRARDPIASEVLNSTWVADTYGNEDNKFQKNQCEEALFDVEDDEYELEILIETARSALRALEPLAARVACMGAEARSLLRLVRADLPPSVVRMVRTLYMSQAEDAGPPHGNMLELLLEHPAAAVPVLAARLRAAIGKWRELREEMVPAWQQITDLNYKRSLDHASFKQPAET